MDLVKQKCCSLKSLKLYSVPKIVDVKGLIEVELFDIQNISNESFTTFIENNGQLEKLKLVELNNQSQFNLDILHNRLPLLKFLEIGETEGQRRESHCDFVINIPKLTLSSLETLEMKLTENQKYARILRALDCCNLKNLLIWWSKRGNNADHDDNVNGILIEMSKFKMLTALRIPDCTVTTDQMRLLAEHLLPLIIIEIEITESESNQEAESKIFSILSLFPEFKKFQIFLPDFQRFFLNFKTQSMYEFYLRFINQLANTEVKIVGKSGSTISASRDRIFVSNKSDGTLELHWMDNFNEKNVRNTLKEADIYCPYYLRFINNCSNSLDVSILSSVCSPDSLEIKSKGSIKINQFVSM